MKKIIICFLFIKFSEKVISDWSKHFISSDTLHSVTDILLIWLLKNLPITNKLFT